MNKMMKLFSLTILLFLSVQCTKLGLADSCLAKCRRVNNGCFTKNILTNSIIFYNPLAVGYVSSAQETEPNGNFNDANQNYNYLSIGSNTIRRSVTGVISSDSDIDIITSSTGGAPFKGDLYSKTGTAGCELFYSAQNNLFSSTASVPDSSWKNSSLNGASVIFPYKESQSYSVYIICKGTAGSTYSISDEPYDPGALLGPAYINKETYNICHSSNRHCTARCDRGDLF